MTDWRRHPGDKKFHAGAESCGSFCTWCSGRWALAQEGIERDSNPPHDERCDACERERIDRHRIEGGLAELVTNTAPDWPGLHELFDLGGEAG